MIKLIDQRHVRENRRYRPYDKRLGPRFGVNDDAHRIAEIDWLAVDHRAGGMKRLGEAHAEIAAGDGAAGIAGIDFRSPCPARNMQTSKLETICAPARLGDGDRVADMVVMAVRQQDMGRVRRSSW